MPGLFLYHYLSEEIEDKEGAKREVEIASGSGGGVTSHSSFVPKLGK
jgi:hypothetical protein